MSVNPLTFNFSNNAIRVVMIDNIPWFVAVDVCAAIEIRNPSAALKRLDDDERKLLKNNSIDVADGVINQQLNAEQKINIINESGLYSLILTSRKPEAKNFKKWITAEVLPALRRHGKYEMPDAAAAPFITLTKDDFVDLIQSCVTATLRAERAVAGARPDQLELSDWEKGETLRLYKNGVSAVEIACLINRPISAVNHFLSQNRHGGKTYN
ncbi:MAG: hypothetical protein HC889_20115 [Synechococcaceae cyanobacterium SM1_2_3]|nr:hypothetical protein [Synechococcaceae cyanobacterium SM1_2_3]